MALFYKWSPLKEIGVVPFEEIRQVRNFHINSFFAKMVPEVYSKSCKVNFTVTALVED